MDLIKIQMQEYANKCGKPRCLKIYRGDGYRIHVDNYHLRDEKPGFLKVFTLRINDTIVGVASVDSKLRLLNDVYFYPEYRNKGWGTKLLSFLMSYYPAKCLDAIAHQDSKMPQAKLVQFYSKFGFEKQVSYSMMFRRKDK